MLLSSTSFPSLSSATFSPFFARVDQYLLVGEGVWKLVLQEDASRCGFGNLPVGDISSVPFVVQNQAQVLLLRPLVRGISLAAASVDVVVIATGVDDAFFLQHRCCAAFIRRQLVTGDVGDPSLAHLFNGWL